MRIEKIEIRGFGKLTRFPFAFEPEMNVIWGPNEAGKSTLLEFLYRMLYGFRDAEASPEDARERDRWRPWSGGSYGGQLRLRLDDRRRFLIDRDFEENTVEIREVTSRESRFRRDEEAGESGEFRPEAVLGMPPEVYRTTAMLLPGRAADVLEYRELVREALLRAEGGRGGDAQLDAAAKSIKEKLERTIGGESSRFSPLAAKRARLEGLRAELARILQKRMSLGRIRREIAQIEDRTTGKRRSRTGKKLRRLRSRAANVLNGERERSVVEEEIRVCEEDIEALTDAREVHLMAARTLEAVSREEYKGFAGDLDAELGRTIPRVTVGRYRVGAVDPEDLSMTVKAPGAPGPVPVEHFSQGTRIQMFGLLRFAISRYLGRAREPAPMLLDEPYAECDPDRLVASCGNLLDVAREHQVVVVTHKREILELCGVSQTEVRRVVVREGSRRRGLRAVSRR